MNDLAVYSNPLHCCLGRPDLFCPEIGNEDALFIGECDERSIRR
jgi:hypothetical protein